MTSKAKSPDQTIPKPGKAEYHQPQLLDYGQLSQITLSKDFAGNSDGGNYPTKT